MIIGLSLCGVLAIAATWLAGLQHYIGAPMLGLFLGIIVSNLRPVSAEVQKGTKYASGKLLKFGIILAGSTLNFMSILGVGMQALPLILFNICLAFTVALLLGRRLKTSTNTGILVGGGTAICGGTAIATLTSIIKAKEDEFAYAMAAIFLFDIFSAMMWPYAALAMHLTPEQ
ncbi:MAG: putative sulfate exporter family transporter, partial [Negativicutes bacterium]|nr:putative sulfate exporter family transporter [Negativicutes bacterium]